MNEKLLHDHQAWIDQGGVPLAELTGQQLRTATQKLRDHYDGAEITVVTEPSLATFLLSLPE